MIVIGFGLLLLLGLGFALGGFDSGSDSKSDPETADPDAPTPSDFEDPFIGTDAADTASASGSQSALFGGEGNDTLTAAKGATAVGEGGDDHLKLWNSTGFGGDGDDLIRLRGGSPDAYGGAGDDTISDRLLNEWEQPPGPGAFFGKMNLSGGDGDDAINVQYTGNADVNISGGSGNDDIEISQTVPGDGKFSVELGEGEDTLTVNQPFHNSAYSPDNQVVDLVVSDFNPEEDMLIFDIASPLWWASTYGQSDGFDADIQLIPDFEDQSLTVEFTAFASDDVNGDIHSRTTIKLEGITDLPDEAFQVVLNGSNGNTYTGDENLVVNVDAPGQNTTVSNGTIVIGTEGDDSFNIVNNTRLADHVVFGGMGDDSFTNTGTGGIRIHAGDGDDSANLTGAQSSVINMNDGDDSVAITGAFNGVYGGTGDDTLSADGSNNRLYGGEGNDLLQVSGSGNVVFMDEGNDVAISDGGNFIVFDGIDNPDTDVATINITQADIAADEISRVHSAGLNDTININLPDGFDGNVHLIDFAYSYDTGEVTQYSAQTVVVLSDATIDEVVMDLTGVSFNINDSTIYAGFQHAFLSLGSEYQVIATLDLGSTDSSVADPGIAQRFTLNLNEPVSSNTQVDIFGVLA